MQDAREALAGLVVLSPVQGLAAQTAAAASIAAGDIRGAPASTTHVMTSAVAGLQ